MGLKSNNTERKVYIGIIGGRLARRFEEHQHEDGKQVTEDRQIKDDNNVVVKTVIERYYDEIDGFITGVSIDTEGNFGARIILEMMDAGEKFIIQMGLESNYGVAFMKRCTKVDSSAKVTIRPYSFDDKESGKKQIGLVIYQKDRGFDKDKIPYAWTKENPGVMPQWESKETVTGTKWNNDNQIDFLASQMVVWAKSIVPDALEDEPVDMIGGEGVESENIEVPETEAITATNDMLDQVENPNQSEEDLPWEKRNA